MTSFELDPEKKNETERLLKEMLLEALASVDALGAASTRKGLFLLAEELVVFRLNQAREFLEKDDDRLDEDSLDPKAVEVLKITSREQ